MISKAYLRASQIKDVKALGYLVLIGVIAMLASCGNETADVAANKKAKTWSCSAETVETSDGGSYFADGGHRFEKGETQSADYAHSGKFSIKISESSAFSMTFVIENVSKGDAIEISAWRHKDDKNLGVLVVSSEDGSLYRQVKTTVASEGDWELVQGLVYIDQNLSDGKVKCYIFNPHSQPTYFDDFSVTHFPSYQYPSSDAAASIQLLFNHDQVRKLDKKRQAALELGALFAADDDWVRGQMIFEGDTLSINARLKGDWLDHLHGIKWSFRIKVRDGSFMGMRTFSIHTPEARDWLNEWAFHQLLEEEDILTTRYGLVPVTMNGQSLGVYAYEEHFDKQLVEHKKRREGPIIKMNEDALFELTVKSWQDEVSYSRDLIPDLSEIQPFKASKVSKTPSLANLFAEGQRLLYQHQQNLSKSSEIFDVSKLARLYALCDVVGSHHGLGWHNQRFYMNPVSNRLEPIGYDSFTNWHERDQEDLIGKTAISAPRDQDDYIQLLPFQDKVFVNAYIKALEEFSQPKYLETFFEKHDAELSSMSELVKAEISGYEFDRTTWDQRRAYAAEQLVAYKDLIRTTPPKFVAGHKLLFRDPAPMVPVSSQSLRCYLSDSLAGNFTLNVVNVFSEPLELVGYGTKVSMAYPLDNPLLVEPHYISRKTYSVKTKGTWCYFRVPGQVELFKREITWWEMPSGRTARQLLEDKSSIPSAFKAVGDTLWLSGTQTFKSNVVIPAGYVVAFKSASKVTINNCSFISYSPVSIVGTADNPIVFNSNNAQGFTVLSAEGRSKVTHAIFNDFNTQLIPGWTLTGAVNFYESDVDLVHVQILNNVCEDALNIIRSDFSVDYCEIRGTWGDGFDADFCTGSVTNSVFANTGNDCIDFSTSQIIISDCKIGPAGDKAISGGENSQLTVSNVEIFESNIGIASKDLSRVTISNSSLDKCRYGYTIFQKKKEFGSASIFKSSMTETAIDTLMLIEIGSFLESDGKRIKGDKSIDLELLYDL
jgi:hypothetical protein